MTDTKLFKEAMSRLGAAVNIVTSDGKAGLAGTTVSAVCSVTDTPPTLLVCLNINSHQYPRFIENGVLCVNVLHGGQEALSQRFSGAEGLGIEERFEHTAWSTLATKAPVLTEALVSFDCRITEVTQVGTHGVLFCEIEQIQMADHKHGLFYFKRAYHQIGHKHS